MPASHFLRQHWPTVTIAVTAAAIGCTAIVMFSNMPPHRIVMATGPEGSAYYEGRQALPGGARESGRGSATSLDGRFGRNRCLAARSALGRERRPDPGRRRRRNEYGRPRIIGHRGIRAVVVVPQAREPGCG